MKNFSAISRSFTRLLMAALFVFPFLAGFANPVFAAHGERGAVFTLSNEASGNSVLVYSRQPADWEPAADLARRGLWP